MDEHVFGELVDVFLLLLELRLDRKEPGYRSDNTAWSGEL